MALSLGAADSARAHELRPSLLDVQLEPDGRARVRWRRGKGVPRLVSVPPPSGCRATVHQTDVTYWDCGPDGLVGRDLRAEGLFSAGTDVLVRVHSPTGEPLTHILRAEAPSWTVPPPTPGAAQLLPWLEYGARHAAEGLDHLLFLFGLAMALAHRPRALALAATGFTVGHGTSLALTSAGLISAPTAAVEAIIALSIVLLATERLNGSPGAVHRRPMALPTVCGLVHGLGFASALAPVRTQAGIAPLLGFNLGVEVLQLGALLLMLPIARWARRLEDSPLDRALIWGLGAAGAALFLSRAAPILAP